MKQFKHAAILLAVMFLTACGGGGSSSNDQAPVVITGDDAAVTIMMRADYGDGRSSVPSVLTECTSALYDSDGYVAGTDCDSDGGVVAYLDPTGFKVALKRLALVMSDSTYVDLIADTGTLADSVVLDLANPVQLDVSSIPQGTYTSFYVEFYYYDLAMGLYGETKEMRIYLSDDDFPAEGNLGNHQGDLRMKDASNVFGFVFPGVAWTDANLVYTRPGGVIGASTPDPETGHYRGLYGNDDLWNAAPFMQGADKDIFAVQDILNMTGVTVGSTGGTMTVTFDLTESWFFEDFNANGLFEPCINDSAEGCGGEWTPVFPGINFSFE